MPEDLGEDKFFDLMFTKVTLAIPFWIVWTYFGIGAKYFYFLPAVYLHPEFLNCIGIFIIVTVVLGVLTPIPLPIHSKSKSKSDKGGESC